MTNFLRSFHYYTLTVIFVLVGVMTSYGQDKKTLDHDVYDIWNFINEQTISADGRWVMWSYSPVEGDAELRIQNVTSGQTYSAARGYQATFSRDARFAAFKIKAQKDSVRQAKLDEKKSDEMPKDSLGILSLTTGERSLVERVKSYMMPEEGAGWIAYLLEKAIEAPDTTAVPDTTAAEEPAEEEGEEGDDEKEEKDKAEGTTLVLRNLETGTETRFEDVTEYMFSEDGAWLVYTASNKEGDADGIITVETETGRIITLMTGEGEYKRPAIDKNSEQVAFLSNRNDFEADQPSFTLYYARLGAEAAATLATEGHEALNEGWWVSEHRPVSFSKNGERLFFGTAPRPDPEPDDEDVLEEEKVTVDVWSWTDPTLQPMQLVQLEEEKNRSYLAVVMLDDQQVVQLADEEIPGVNVGSEGNADVAVSSTNMPYRKQVSWDYPIYHDIYLIDVLTGEHRMVLEGIQSSASLSPESNYIFWWNHDELAWYVMDVESGESVNVTSQIPYPVHNERHDWPYKPSSYGSAGWTENDAELLIYDNHDLWAVSPTGHSSPRNVTDGLGREENLRFRYIRLDPDETAIDPSEPILLSSFHYQTKADGFYRDRVAGNDDPESLIMMDKAFSRPQKAEDAGTLLFTVQSFVDFPNLWTSDMDFGDLFQVSDVNPQQSDYLWGTAELVEWASIDGTLLQGILFKPENFDPAEQYPMMVYFYERSSDGLHSHRTPQVQGSIINISFYVSRGYLVFVPDIPYKVGYPGESAMNAVMPGVTNLIAQGFVDEANIGVQGHSWGGYQIAYMITQTNLFKAAEAGAPVSNMTSAYGGIRWGSGMSRMFQYEKTQSRIGGSLWEYPLRYIHNSPLFQADKIETPVLMMHNDKDTAVPWYQGIEFFVALRRLNKPVWLINYNDEPHNLVKFQHRKDWAIRMQQFFDHYLKDAPAPQWMIEGVPAITKGTTLGLETAAEE